MELHSITRSFFLTADNKIRVWIAPINEEVKKMPKHIEKGEN